MNDLYVCLYMLEQSQQLKQLLACYMDDRHLLIEELCESGNGAVLVDEIERIDKIVAYLISESDL